MFKVNNRVVMERKRLLTELVSVCTMNESGSYYKEGKLQVHVNPTGCALLKMAEKMGYCYTGGQRSDDRPIEGLG